MAEVNSDLGIKTAFQTDFGCHMSYFVFEMHRGQDSWMCNFTSNKCIHSGA